MLDDQILGPLGMVDTGFFLNPQSRRRAATMYALTPEGTLRHSVMGPPQGHAAGVLPGRRRIVVDGR